MRQRIRRVLFGVDPHQVVNTVLAAVREYQTDLADRKVKAASHSVVQEQLAQHIQWIQTRLTEQREFLTQLEGARRRLEGAAAQVGNLAGRPNRDAADGVDEGAQAATYLNGRISVTRRRLQRWLDQVGQVAAPTEDEGDTAEPDSAIAAGRVLSLPTTRVRLVSAQPNHPSSKPRRVPLLTIGHDGEAGGAHRWRPGAVEDGGAAKPSVGRTKAMRRSAAPPIQTPQIYPESGDQVPAAAAMGTHVSTEINRFLEGKVLGQDLLSPQGSILAAKGDPITAELAEEAEQAGVLPDLILCMTWRTEEGA